MISESSEILDSKKNNEGQATTLHYINDYEELRKLSMNEKISFTQELNNEFDPKKAILYSEIFKPKYF